jgi:hypothetical protein
MLAAIATLLIAFHTLGAALGAAGATYAEIIYTKAMADGRIDRREREYFMTTYWALQWGMLTVLVTGLALVVVQFFLPASPDATLYEPLWIQNTLALIITVSAWMLGRSFISWGIGSALVFAGWWMLLILDCFRDYSFSYLGLLFIYVFLAFCSAVFWGYARVLAHKHVSIEDRS